MSHYYMNQPMFSLLPPRRAPWKEFALSVGTECLAVVLLTWLAVLHPAVLEEVKRDYHAIALVTTPTPVNHKPAPVKVIKPVTPEAPLPEIVHPVEALHIQPEVRRRVQPETPIAPAPKIEVAEKPLPPMVPVIPRKLVKVDSFSTGSSAIPTIAAAPKKTQTGGFGDPNGIPARANTNGKPANIAQLGGFDMPTGPGVGNGTGGAKGVKGVIASAGFGSGTAIGDGSGTVNTTRGTVRVSGFGDAEPAASGPVRPKQELQPQMVPAEVVFKPSPIYTDEAKKLRIEGEVLLEVVFESSGKLRILRVIRGLGHGLDEAAVRAAEQIHFKPALRDGQPADSTAVLHIVFQLA